MNLEHSIFVKELKDLGYDPQVISPNKVSLEFKIEFGANSGEPALLGFENFHDFPLNVPHGPHWKPKNDSWKNPNQGIHASQFGSGWVHWSRPYNDWPKVKEKSVKMYLRHINKLLVEL